MLFQLNLIVRSDNFDIFVDFNSDSASIRVLADNFEETLTNSKRIDQLIGNAQKIVRFTRRAIRRS